MKLHHGMNGLCIVKSAISLELKTNHQLVDTMLIVDISNTWELFKL